jgi:F1F0 ATPase subunit 2
MQHLIIEGLTHQSWQLVLACFGGMLLGSFFFGSLWITVRQLPTTAWPIRLIVGSYVSRMAIAFLGFYLIMQGDWKRAIAGLVGFIVMRYILIRRFQSPSLPRLTLMK